MMLRIIYFYFLLLLYILTTVNSYNKIFGVAPELETFYESDVDFRCLDNVHLIIPFSYINDDYCDCEDGSDEPGTAACKQSLFHCENIGDDAQDIPSSRVHDGICDCCDGTDEVFSDKITCDNTCVTKTISEPNEADSILNKTIEIGRIIKAQLVRSGTQKVNKLIEIIADLSSRRRVMQKVLFEKERIYEQWKKERERATKAYREIRRQEVKHQEDLRQYRNDAINYFRGYDANDDGLISVEEVKHSKLFDKNNDGTVSEAEAKYYFHGEDFINLEYFLSKTWQLLKPFKVDINEVDKIVHSSEFNENDLLILGNKTSDRVREKQYLLKSAKNLDKYKSDSNKIWKQLREVETAYYIAQHNLKIIDEKIKKNQDYLNQDFGKHNEYFDLDEKCINYDDDEFSYRFCFFKAITQFDRSNRGKIPITIGYFEKWAGDQDDIHMGMRYSNGTACWHGHKRVATVRLRCGDVNEIAAVDEPFPCKYEIDLITPAACEYKSEHDEL